MAKSIVEEHGGVIDTITIIIPDRLLRLIRDVAHPLLLTGIFALALGIRMAHVLRGGFPLNDGGLFHVMAADIQRAGYALPDFTSYNDGTIPFAYPPLAFYLAALLDDLTSLSLLDGIWLLPLFESVLVVGAFYLLARAIFHDLWTALIAAAAFALVPRSFIWLIMGGGLTRALGLALALFALHQAYRACEESRWAPAARSSVLLALTILTTLEAAAFLVSSLPLFTLFPAHRRRLVTLAGIGAGGVLLASPWWVLMLGRHGLDPFRAASDCLQDRVRLCLGGDADCLESLDPPEGGERFTHVYLPDICCTALRAALEGDQGYEVLYDDGAMVLRRRGAVAEMAQHGRTGRRRAGMAIGPYTPGGELVEVASLPVPD